MGMGGMPGGMLGAGGMRGMLGAGGMGMGAGAGMGAAAMTPMEPQHCPK